MIYGTGTDITEIERVARLCENSRFLDRFFSQSENELFKKRNYRPETIAANFAAKEAFSKALGTGIRGFSLREVSVLRDPLGKPYIELSGRALELAAKKRVHLSLSHSKKYAVAYVIIEEIPK